MSHYWWMINSHAVSIFLANDKILHSKAPRTGAFLLPAILQVKPFYKNVTVFRHNKVCTLFQFWNNKVCTFYCSQRQVHSQSSPNLS